MPIAKVGNCYYACILLKRLHSGESVIATVTYVCKWDDEDLHFRLIESTVLNFICHCNALDVISTWVNNLLFLKVRVHHTND